MKFIVNYIYWLLDAFGAALCSIGGVFAYIGIIPILLWGVLFHDHTIDK